MKHPGGIIAADVGGDAHAGHPADPCADLLYSGHQWKGKEQRPEHCESELSASLRICCDSAGVVIGGTGHDTGPHLRENSHDVRPPRGGLAPLWLRRLLINCSSAIKAFISGVHERFW